MSLGSTLVKALLATPSTMERTAYIPFYNTHHRASDIDGVGLIRTHIFCNVSVFDSLPNVKTQEDILKLPQSVLASKMLLLDFD